MRRGTTPTIIFTIPTEAFKVNELTDSDKLNVAFSQNNVVVISKNKEELELDGTTNSIICRLTEQDTLNLSAGCKCENNNVEMQVRVGIGTERIASNIVTTRVDRILKDGLL